MNKWTAAEIKKLRLSLGWSAANFSRHFSCQANLILEWENGAQVPSPDDLLQMKRLEFHLESYCDQVIRDASADRLLKQTGLEQICQIESRDLNR